MAGRRSSNPEGIPTLPLLILRPRRHLVRGDYLAWAVNPTDAQRRIHREARGTSLRLVSKTVPERLDVPLPGPDTQRSIAAIKQISPRLAFLALKAGNSKKPSCAIFEARRLADLQRQLLPTVCRRSSSHPSREDQHPSGPRDPRRDASGGGFPHGFRRVAIGAALYLVSVKSASMTSSPPPLDPPLAAPAPAAAVGSSPGAAPSGAWPAACW